MRVLCVRLPSPVAGVALQTSPWVDVDRQYTVVAVTCDQRGLLQLQLITDSDDLGWFDADCFVTVETSIPPTWTVRLDERGNFDLAPAAWHARGLWERYYDGDSEARAIVESELSALLGGSPTSSPDRPR